MSNKQLTSLFICNMLPYGIAIALLAVMPIYLRQLGGDPAQTGVYLALIYVALIAGTLAGGWLSNHFNRRKHFLLLGAIGCLPATYLMGQAGDPLSCTLFAMAAWFFGGIQVTMVNILTGLYADKEKRGRTFGIIGASIALSQMLGGLLAGPVVDRWGFTLLFNASALLYILAFMVGLLLEDKQAAQPQPAHQTTPPPAMILNLGFLALVIGSILVHAASTMTNMARPLMMDSLDFSTSAITSVIAVSGAANLPLPFLMGWLSDRVGRKSVLIGCYGVVALGIILLSRSSALWHFWMAQTLITTYRSTQVVGAALVADFAPRRQLSSSLSHFAMMPWIGGLVGYALTGTAIQNFGPANTLLIGALLPLAAVLVLLASNAHRLSLPHRIAGLGHRRQQIVTVSNAPVTKPHP